MLPFAHFWDRLGFELDMVELARFHEAIPTPLRDDAATVRGRLEACLLQALFVNHTGRVLFHAQVGRGPWQCPGLPIWRFINTTSDALLQSLTVWPTVAVGDGSGSRVPLRRPAPGPCCVRPTPPSWSSS